MKNKVEVNTVKPELTFSVDENSYRILDFETENNLDSLIKDIENYLSNTNGQGKTEEEKDEAYAQAQDMWRKYQSGLRESRFNFNLNRSQYNLLTDIIVKKLEYDVNTVFIAIELTELLGIMRSVKFENDDEIKEFKVTATEITYIYHLIQNYKVKGLTKESYTFSKILIRIGDVSKIVNYYDTYAKNLTDEISKWALSLDEAGSLNLIDELEETQAQNIQE
jgi:hypothetical protein